VSRNTMNNMRKRLEKRDAVYPGAVTGERRCPALAHPRTVEKILEICLDSRDNELFQELEAIKGRRREARAAKESGRKERRGWSDKPKGRAENDASQSCCPGEDEHAAPPRRVDVPEPDGCMSAERRLAEAQAARPRAVKSTSYGVVNDGALLCPARA
jgi:hypothetical protein